MGKGAGLQKAVREIQRRTRRRFSAEEEIRIVVEGLRGEESIAELCRREGLAPNLYYRWSKEFLEVWCSPGYRTATRLVSPGTPTARDIPARDAAAFGGNGRSRSRSRSKAWSRSRNRFSQTHSFFRLPKKRSIMPFCSGVYGVMYSWSRPYRRATATKLFAPKTSPLSDLSASSLLAGSMARPESLLERRRSNLRDAGLGQL